MILSGNSWDTEAIQISLKKHRNKKKILGTPEICLNTVDVKINLE